MPETKKIYIGTSGWSYSHWKEVFYPSEMLEDFAGKFRKWINKGHVIWAFFNNDIHGYALVNAKRLEAMMK